MPSKTSTVETEPQYDAAFVKALAEAIRETGKTENLNAIPERWNGYGKPGFPKLRWSQVFYCGVLLRPRSLTAGETERLNAITRAGEYSDGERTYVVKITDGKEPTLDIRVPGVNTAEGRLGMPSFERQLQAILDGQAAN